MKKLFIGLFTVMLAVSFIACKPSSGTDDNSTTDQTSSGGDQNPAPTYIGTKAPTEAKAVGDIVFNDGSSTPYTPGITLTDAQKSAAIALIFYKGTGLNSGNNTTTTRTLGVGLKQNKDGLEWCIDTAAALDKNISAIQCAASGSAGDKSFVDSTANDRNGSDNLAQIEAFEGVDDTATAANYPAFYFGKNYATSTVTNIAAGSEFATGWYLPSSAELYQIYANGMGSNKVFDLDAASEALDGDKFESSQYWSSSQNCDDSMPGFEYAADIFTFTNGDFHYDGKQKTECGGTKICVCCIREF